jgi:hypothetical protein
MAIEKNLWTAWGKKDGEPFKKILTADAVEVVAGTAPVIGRDAIIKDITSLPCELRSFAHKDAKLRRRASGCRRSIRKHRSIDVGDNVRSRPKSGRKPISS